LFLEKKTEINKKLKTFFAVKIEINITQFKGYLNMSSITEFINKKALKKAESEYKKAVKEAKKEYEKETKLALKAFSAQQKKDITPLDTVETFFSKKRAFQSLSNFAQLDCEWEQVTYPTGESAFHAAKFITIAKHIDDKKRALELTEFAAVFSDPHLLPKDAKKMGKTGLRLTQDELDIWHVNCVVEQNAICESKYFKHQQVRDDIMITKNKTLVHTATRCSEEKVVNCFWEGKAVIRDGGVVILGSNWLGRVWMNIRETNSVV
jgi:predicted NAD-dependent protein-ADP-ribosyltransferase YbiA (DUF1768 family)